MIRLVHTALKIVGTRAFDDLALKADSYEIKYLWNTTRHSLVICH